MKNDMTMISKARGDARLNGRGKNLAKTKWCDECGMPEGKCTCGHIKKSAAEERARAAQNVKNLEDRLINRGNAIGQSWERALKRRVAVTGLGTAAGAGAIGYGAYRYGKKKGSVSKSRERLTAEQKRRQRTEARVGLTSNVLGLAAGTAALGTNLRDPRLKDGGRSSQALYRVGQKIPSPIASRLDKLPAGKRARIAAGLATSGVALQSANLGGDVVANRVLQRSAEVKKADLKTRLRASQAQRDAKLSGEKGRKTNLVSSGIMAGAAGGYIGSTVKRKANWKIVNSGPNHHLLQMVKQPNKKNAVLGAALGAVGGGALATAENSLARKRHTKLVSAMRSKGVDPTPLTNLAKAYRRFDAEADRQRRIGQYQGLGLGTSIVTGAAAGQHYTTKLQDTAGNKVRGVGFKSGKTLSGKTTHGRAGLALTAASVLSGYGGLKAYKHGTSVRNQPWT